MTSIVYEQIEILRSTHPIIRRLKREEGNHSLHGNKVWKSSLVAIDFMHRLEVEGANVLELGAGWGAVSVYCAKMMGANVTALDADADVFKYLQAQAKHNDVNIKQWHERYENVTQAQLAKFDMVIGADVCFWDEMTQPLYQLCERAVKAGVPYIQISDPGRPPFWQLAELAHEHLGADCREWTNESLQISAQILDIEQ